MIEEMKTFMRVIEFESFTKAAESLHLSQPSVSIHIRRLEEHFGTTLIKRSNKEKHINITETGHVLYRRAEQILRLLEETQEEINGLQERIAGNLKIGASFTIGEYVLPAFLGKLNHIYPEMTWDVAISNTEEICKQVEALKLDVGLIEGGACTKGLITYPFAVDTMLLVTGDEVMSGRFDVQKLQNQVWISREEGSGTSEMLHQFLKDYKIKPKRIMRMSSNYAVKEAVAYGLGITLISQDVIREDIVSQRLYSMELPKTVERHLTCITSKDTYKSCLKEAFIEQLRGKGKKGVKDEDGII